MVNHPRRSKRAATAAVTAPVHDHDFDYETLRQAVAFAFETCRGRPLFTTNAEGLFDLFLANVGDEGQIHTCHACRRFIDNYGSLVVINDDGRSIPVAFATGLIPEFYGAAITKMRDTVARARVTGVFYAKEKTLGLPATGDWTHFAAENHKPWNDRLLTAGQGTAAKREDFVTVARALADFTPEMIWQALKLLEAEYLDRSEKFVAPMRWLRDLHAKRAEVKGPTRDNILWLAVATAPEGYCHPRSSMTGTLLEDIAAGLSFAEVKSRFNSKMHPLQYQRPTAAPSAGNIAAAEKIVETLGIRKSLDRRFARMSDIRPFWVPKIAEKKDGGGSVFGHLKPKGAATVRDIDVPASVITWEKFERTVLPTAEQIEFYVPSRGNFIGFTAASDADAPPILKWDRDDERNTVAWYVYHSGSPASQWGLTGYTWAPVSALTRLPTMWGSKPMPHVADGLVGVIDGACDTRVNSGNALFPETLRDDLHQIRSVVEAYSRSAEHTDRSEQVAGFDIRKGSEQINVTLRVTSGGQKVPYKIDRWD